MTTTPTTDIIPAGARSVCDWEVNGEGQAVKRWFWGSYVSVGDNSNYVDAVDK